MASYISTASAVPAARALVPANATHLRMEDGLALEHGMKVASIQPPRVHGPAALAGIDHQRGFLQHHPDESPWHGADAMGTGQHERAPIDVARSNAFLDAGRAGRERERRLRDDILRIRF